MTLEEIQKYADHTAYLSTLLKNSAEIMEHQQQEIERLKRELAAVNSRKKDEVVNSEQ